MRIRPGHRVTVAGLGHFGGGIAVAKWLVEQRAEVTVTDLAPAEKLAESIAYLDGLPIRFKLGGHDEKDFTDADLVVTSPAVPPTSPYLQAATKAGVPITTEIALFVHRCPTKKVLGVTGTKGKSTTSALLHAMLGSVGRSWLGGNIGRSLLPEIANIQSDDFVVLELSSFMLHWLGREKWSPHVAVVTMLAVDHLDWHGSAEAYLADKSNIVRHQKPGDFAVLRHDDKVARSWAELTPAEVKIYGKRAHLPEAFAPLLPGKHNRINERGAWTAARIFGVYPDMAVEALKDFRGLPHRLQLVHEFSGVQWINDSIATIPAAAVAAMEAFPADRVIQIVGGKDKSLDFSAMCEALATRAKAVLTIGQTGEKLAAMCEASSNRKATIIHCETLDRAVAQAMQLATAGDVVLLSTGCSSYDQFAHFEERGERFAQLARTD